MSELRDLYQEMAQPDPQNFTATTRSPSSFTKTVILSPQSGL